MRRVEFLGDLRAVFEKNGDLAKKFEVTYQVGRLFGRLEDGEAMVPIERCKGPIFNLLVKPEHEARQLAQELATAASAADPCCWGKWNGVKLFAWLLLAAALAAKEHPTNLSSKRHRRDRIDSLAASDRSRRIGQPERAAARRDSKRG